MSDSLSHAIANFDGADFTALEAAVADHFPSADDLAGLVVLVQVGDLRAQLAAAWALGRLVARGLPLLPAERRALLRCLDEDRAWQVKERLCLAVRYLRTPPDVALTAAASLERLAAHDHRNVRLAALDGLAALAERFPQLQEWSDRAVERALDDTAPSVRAKARVLLRG
ncbi:MAG: hypothetical protein EA356_17195 [Geminicoccaceae bacterium]|nr:MAG: hypothetical protein EA356_17195 [Geminicoccaceae bacterium]